VAADPGARPVNEDQRTNRSPDMHKHWQAAVAVVLLAAGLAACGESKPDLPPVAVEGPALLEILAEAGEVVLDGPGAVTEGTPARLVSVGRHLQAAVRDPNRGAVRVDYPHGGSIFPPEIVPPTFLWHDTSFADAWFVEVTFADGGAPLRALVRGPSPPLGEIDPTALSKTNEIYRGTPDQQSARSWEVSAPLWEEIKRRSVGREATVTFLGFAAERPTEVLSVGDVRLSTSKDPVGAPVFYRDVPLMPAPNESGLIQPLDKGAVPLINWRLRDIARPESKIVLSGMPSCANCHSFSLDGKTLGMDVDGPQGDKGAYAIADIQEKTVIRDEDVITWNSFADKPEGHKTIGFLSRISPDGRYAITTLNESLYVSNFLDYRFLQVFYPTRGILAWYSRESKEMKALPGADSAKHVQCDPAWSPDGKWLVFARADAVDPYRPGQDLAKFANDPNESTMRYSLYRIPFNEGKGGTPEPVEGASHNGVSNTFPKVSPDGKWIVFTKCRNGQLMRPDGKLWIVPFEGGKAREMRCNTSLMNSWHSFSPNARWLAFSSKANTPYTQMFLTHIDENGDDSPAILVPNSTAANRAVNIPEFLNASYDALDEIEIPAVAHHRWLAKGLEAKNEGRYDEALADFRKALEYEPSFSRAHANLGSALAERGEFKEAIRHLETAIEVNPLDASSWNALGYARAQMGELGEAMRIYHHALELSPKNPFVHNNLGLAFRELGRPDEALRHFETAVELYPQYVEAWKSVGFQRLARKDENGALAAYRKAIDLAPDDAVAQRSAGRTLLDLGRVAEALPYLRKAAALDPQDVATRLGLAWQLATHPDAAVRDGEQAVVFAEEARDLTKSEQPGPFDVLAAAYAEAGRWPDAVQAAKTAQRLAGEGRGPVASGLADRLALYESRRPFRQASHGE